MLKYRVTYEITEHERESAEEELAEVLSTHNGKIEALPIPPQDPYDIKLYTVVTGDTQEVRVW